MIITSFSVDTVGRIQRRAHEQQHDVYARPFQRHSGGRQQFGFLVGAQRAEISETALPEQQLVHVPQDRRKIRPKLFVHVHGDGRIGQSGLVSRAEAYLS